MKRRYREKAILRSCSGSATTRIVFDRFFSSGHGAKTCQTAPNLELSSSS